MSSGRITYRRDPPFGHMTGLRPTDVDRSARELLRLVESGAVTRETLERRKDRVAVRARAIQEGTNAR